MHIPIAGLTGQLDWGSLPYHDDGLARALSRGLRENAEIRIRESLGDRFVSLKIVAEVPAEESLKRACDRLGFRVNLRLLQVDVDRAASDSIDGFALTSGVRVGRYGWDGGFAVLPLPERVSILATRTRFVVRSCQLLVPLPNRDHDAKLVRDCNCALALLHPLPRHCLWGRVVVWRCGVCERKYLCNCSMGLVEFYATRKGFSNTDSAALLEQCSYRQDICHLCRGVLSSTIYRSPMYGGSDVHNLYYPYINQRMVLRSLDQHDAENEVRDALGVPRIGEGWISESLLAGLIRALFPDLLVERQASPHWLERQRFDIYLPEIGLAVEYQGEQHFEAVEIFGGAEGFRKTVERDHAKRARSMAAGVEVVEFRYDEPLTEGFVLLRLAPIIQRLRKARGL